MKIIFATGNGDKMREVREILGDLQAEIVSMKEAGIVVDVEENGSSFEENALIKARAIAEHTEEIVLADDSGLEIDYLNGEPGIYSARYLGEETSYDYKNKVILERMEGVSGKERSARFVCAIAAVVPQADGTKKEYVVRGTFEGEIAHEIMGENGFGYDPIFFVPECNCTSAQLSPEEKNARSHRGMGLRMIKEKLLK